MPKEQRHTLDMGDGRKAWGDEAEQADVSRKTTPDPSIHTDPEKDDERNEEKGDDPENLNPQVFVVAPSRRSSQHVDAGRLSSSSTTSPPAAGQETYPEGGRRAWLVVLGSWLALSASLGLMNTIATFQTYVSAHQLAGRSQGEIGWIFGLHAFLAFFLGVYIGPVFDKHGPRWLVATGTALLFAALMLLSVSTELWHFLLTFGVLAGSASALLFTPSFAAVGHFFKRRRGFATGVAATGGGIGGVVWPLVLPRLFDAVGYTWAVRVLALVSLVLSGVANLVSPPSTTQQHSRAATDTTSAHPCPPPAGAERQRSPGPTHLPQCTLRANDSGYLPPRVRSFRAAGLLHAICLPPRLRRRPGLPYAHGCQRGERRRPRASGLVRRPHRRFQREYCRRHHLRGRLLRRMATGGRYSPWSDHFFNPIWIRKRK
jgi:hypothetical protein